jgi:hypothetical protein
MKKGEKQLRAYKRMNFAAELFKYFQKNKKMEQWVPQVEIIREMMKLGFSKAFSHGRIKRLSQGIVKRTLNGSSQGEIIEPLLFEESRLKFDGVSGVVYKINDNWRKQSVQEVAGVFDGT